MAKSISDIDQSLDSFRLLEKSVIRVNINRNTNVFVYLVELADIFKTTEEEAARIAIVDLYKKCLLKGVRSSLKN